MNEDLKNALRAGFVTVTFTKKDGTIRTFDKATTNPLLIPDKFHVKSEREYGDTSMHVFVDEIQAWRSISLADENQEIFWEV